MLRPGKRRVESPRNSFLIPQATSWQRAVNHAFAAAYKQRPFSVTSLDSSSSLGQLECCDGILNQFVKQLKLDFGCFWLTLRIRSTTKVCPCVVWQSCSKHSDCTFLFHTRQTDTHSNALSTRTRNA